VSGETVIGHSLCMRSVASAFEAFEPWQLESERR
jgi:hypothetical protein